jgi:hypothetical protein
MSGQEIVLEQPVGPGLRKHIEFFLISFAVLVVRRPDGFFHAQFFAEDGHVWFADAYNLGWWHALFHTWSGYYQTLPRLAAALALLAPFALAPLLLNLMAFAIQALPVNILLSSRSSAWGTLEFRGAMVGIYLVLPNSAELSSGITESMWHLALCAFLLIVAAKPKGIAGWLFDIFILVLCGLTGPFCVFLLPIALYLAWKNHDRRRWSIAGDLAFFCLIQAWAIFKGSTSGDPFDHRQIGLHLVSATPALFTRILASQIYLGTLIGGNGLGASAGSNYLIFFACVAIGGTALVIFCFVKASLQMKLFLAFSVLTFAASLFSSTGNAPPGGWSLLAAAGGIRYWFFPTLVFAWTILWCFQYRNLALKVVSTILLFFMCIGIVRDWRQPVLMDLHFAEYARRFEAAPPGTTMTIPENPEGWTVQLVKRAQRKIATANVVLQLFTPRLPKARGLPSGRVAVDRIDKGL